ncbi:PorT family protein [bacterium]|nr:PorT family protein [bacterium]
MKLLNRSFLALCLIVGFGYSQQSQALLSTSLKGGIGLNKMSSTDSGGNSIAGSSFGIGYQGGLGLEFSLGVASVAADVLFAQRGSFNTLTTSKWKTILVPVQAKFSLIPLLSLGLGGYFSTALGDISTESNLGVSTGTTTFAAANLSKSDFGAVASVGISLPLGVTTLSVEGRYLYGMKNLQTNATGDASTKMSAFDMLVGVTF